MGIIKIEDKHKFSTKVELTPSRTYTSGSNGTTGDVFVFPNRSETQKDNIDERLRYAGYVDSDGLSTGSDIHTELQPYTNDSLEKRRIEIYSGNFRNVLNSPFDDGTEIEYYLETDVGTTLFAAETHSAEDINAIDTSSILVGSRVLDGETLYEWQSNFRWLKIGTQDLYRELPNDNRDFSTRDYSVPLSLLLDGANPLTIDHAWRRQVEQKALFWIEDGQDPAHPWAPPAYNLGNSSLTGANPETYQFTGFVVDFDENGLPVEGDPITNKSQVNAWPPEALAAQGSILTNMIMRGYSDLSMHPRNKTKKEIKISRLSPDNFSKENLKGKIVAREIIKDIALQNRGSFVHNNFDLQLTEYTDRDGTTRKPCLIYPNRNGQYTIDYTQPTTQFTFEFWIKPTDLQINPGTILFQRRNYAIVLIPDEDSKLDGKFRNFKIGCYFGSRVDTVIPTNADVTDLSNQQWVSTPSLSLNEWAHVVIRWGRNYNNGLFSLIIDGIEIEVEDGINDGANRNGIIDVSSISPDYSADGGTANNHTELIVGGWSTSLPEDLWSGFSDLQSGIDGSAGNLMNTGLWTLTSGVPTFVNELQLKSCLTDIRCWSKCLSHEEVTSSRLIKSVSSDLKYLIPFVFDPSQPVDGTGLRRKKFEVQGQAAGTLEELRESTQEIEDLYNNDIFRSNSTMFCPNLAYMLGMPLVNAPMFAKEYVNSEIPVISGYDSFLSDMSFSTEYQTYSGLDWPDTYPWEFVKQSWQDFPWLPSWNSLFLPSTIDKDKSHLVTAGVLRFFRNTKSLCHTLPYGLVSLTSKFECRDIFHDEAILSYLVAQEYVDLDLQDTEWRDVNAELILDRYVDKAGLHDHDFVSPFAVLIEIPSIYYGDSIHPTSLQIDCRVNEELTLQLTDRNGVLYVSDSLDQVHSKVGHVLYHLGIILIDHPALSTIKDNDISITFKGQKNLHIMQLDIPCQVGVGNESKNPNYQNLRPSTNANETDQVTTYISKIYLHDENLNIVGMVNLAEPIQKREADSFLFRIKMDF